jgi:hypothetical protein
VKDIVTPEAIAACVSIARSTIWSLGTTGPARASSTAPVGWMTRMSDEIAGGSADGPRQPCGRCLPGFPTGYCTTVVRFMSK